MSEGYKNNIWETLWKCDIVTVCVYNARDETKANSMEMFVLMFTLLEMLYIAMWYVCKCFWTWCQNSPQIECLRNWKEVWTFQKAFC